MPLEKIIQQMRTLEQNSFSGHDILCVLAEHVKENPCKTVRKIRKKKLKNAVLKKKNNQTTNGYFLKKKNEGGGQRNFEVKIY